MSFVGQKASKQDGSGKCDAYFTSHAEDKIRGVVPLIPVDQKGCFDKEAGVGRRYDEGDRYRERTKDRVPGGGKITSAESSFALLAPASANSEDMTVPTGPEVVGLEMVVLPTAVEGEANDTAVRTCWVTAPACRYGRALYWPQMRFRLSSSTLVVDGEESIPSGTRAECVLDRGFPLHQVDLVLVSVSFECGVLLRLMPAELAEVLAHPWQRVREAALLALGQ